CDTLLGDSVEIRAPNSDFVTIKANVEMGERIFSGGASASITQSIRVDLDKCLIDGKPDDRWLIRFSTLPDRTFTPVAVEDSDAGLRWAFAVKEVRHG